MDDSSIKKAFGTRLRFLRELRGLTQARLAERIGVTEQYVSMLERGLSAPSFSLVAQLSKTLNAPPAALFLFQVAPEDASSLPMPCLPEHLSRVAVWTVDPLHGAQEFSPELRAWLWAKSPRGKAASAKSAQSLYAFVPQDDLPRLKDAVQAAAAGAPVPLFSLRLEGLQPLRVLAYATLQADGLVRLVLMDVTELMYLRQSQETLQAAVETLVVERTRQLQETVAQLEEEVQRRRQSEAALALAEQRWRILFEHAPVGIIQTLPEGRFLAANREALVQLGYDTCNEVLALQDIGRQLYQNPEHRNLVLNALATQGALDSHEIHLKDKNGQPIRATITVRQLPPGTSTNGHQQSFISFIKQLPSDSK